MTHLDVYDEHAESLRALVEATEMERADWNSPPERWELEREDERDRTQRGVVQGDPRAVRLLTALQAGQRRAVQAGAS